MFSFEQRKLIARLERDMKELGLSNDCFLSLSLSNNPQFAKVAPKVLYIANKFMENYRKIDMEVTA